MRNTNAITWSDSEESSHICLYVCALFLRSKMEQYIDELIKLSYKSLKKDEILLFVTTWMDPEDIIISEIEKNKHCMTSLYVECNKK